MMLGHCGKLAICTLLVETLGPRSVGKWTVLFFDTSDRCCDAVSNAYNKVYLQLLGKCWLHVESLTALKLPITLRRRFSLVSCA